MRDDELLGHSRQPEEGGCAGWVAGCLCIFVVMAIVVTIVWLCWPRGS